MNTIDKAQRDNRKMIRGVFFDLYGTLYLYGDMKRAWAVWLNTFYTSLKNIGLLMSQEEFSIACDQFFGKEEPEELDQEMTIFENRIMNFMKNNRLSAPRESIRQIADKTVNSWQNFIDLDSAVIPVLTALRKNYITGLVSNFDHSRHVRECLEKQKIDKLFNTIVISAEVGFKKPDPRIFNNALKETGLKPSEIVYIGDTTDDMKAAEAAGMHSILIKRPVNGTDESALDYSASYSDKTTTSGTHIYTIETLEALVPLIQNMGIQNP